MRKKRNPQLSIFEVIGKNPGPKELEQMSIILDANPEMLDLAYIDLTKDRRADTGRDGLTAEQVLRAAILKHARELTYDELEYYLADSVSFRAFVNLKMGQYPGKSSLQSNIKCLREETWIAIHQLVTSYAHKEKLENGRKLRLDSTTIETDIHSPTDSTLLWDGIRVITRWLIEGKRLSPQPFYRFSDHRRVAKKRLFKIQNTRKQSVREAAYKDMLHYTSKVCFYGETAAHELSGYSSDDALCMIRARNLAEKLARAVNLLTKVSDQTERRVFKGEKIPASEKIVSFFEVHTDIIVKNNRKTEFGHKVFLTGGPSNMILDCLIERGNPADSDRFQILLDRHKKRFGRPPRQTTADGGFASKDNLDYAKNLQVKDVVFSKKRGLSIKDMAKSNWVYQKLKNFRAGIEANISALKRSYGLDRCNWTGWEGFKKYVWGTIVSYNLQVLARLQLAKA